MTDGNHRGEVLFVTSSYPRWAGDATTPFVHHLAQDLQSLGWRVRVLAPHAPGARQEEVLDGVSVRRFRYAWPVSMQTLCYDGGVLPKLRAKPTRILLVPFLIAAQLIAVSGCLLRRRSSLVHSHWLLPQGFTTALAARVAGRPHVATAHGGDVFALRGAVSRFAKRIVLRLADVVTVNSEATRQVVVSLTSRPDKVVRIPMGSGFAQAPDSARIGAVRALMRSPAGPLVAFVGRLVPEKGASDLLEAVARLMPAMPGLTAVVIGDGPERAALERQATDLGLGSRVWYTGWLNPEDVQLHLHASDIFVAPSRPAPDGWVEAQGLTVVEAMLAARPIVASAIGGLPEAVRHEQTGLLVPPAAPGEIAGAIARLVADGGLARRLGENARALALAEFSRAASAAQFAALYAQLGPGQRELRSKT